MVVVAGVVLLVASAVVIYGLGPVFHNRDQHKLLAQERGAIKQATEETDSLYGVQLPTLPPVPGSPVGILVIPAIGLQQAVVEGVGSQQTVAGPGHVPGTAGLGQPGNAAIVARHSGYGGPFSQLDQLRRGDKLETATVEGDSIYVVQSVRTVTLSTPSATSPPTTEASTRLERPATKTSEAGSPGAAETTTTLYGPTADDRLTLVTSSSSTPWNTTKALVVVARMRGRPYAPLPQESRSPSQQGNSGNPGGAAVFVLALLALGLVVAGAVVLYRRTSPRAAYLLTTAPLLACTVLVAVAVSHLLPAWL